MKAQSTQQFATAEALQRRMTNDSRNEGDGLFSALVRWGIQEEPVDPPTRAVSMNSASILSPHAWDDGADYFDQFWTSNGRDAYRFAAF